MRWYPLKANFRTAGDQLMGSCRDLTHRSQTRSQMEEQDWSREGFRKVAVISSTVELSTVWHLKTYYRRAGCGGGTGGARPLCTSGTAAWTAAARVLV